MPEFALGDQHDARSFSLTLVEAFARNDLTRPRLDPRRECMTRASNQDSTGLLIKKLLTRKNFMSWKINFLNTVP